MANFSHNNQHPALQYSEQELEALIDALEKFTSFTAPDGELSIAFLEDSQLAQLHDDFLDDPSPTDVITFPGDPDEELAGEICVSVDRALQLSESGVALPFSEELTLYLIHGWLHLCGLDDKEESTRAQMREAETLVMNHLRQLHAIPHFILK